jgi:hypothetical protein
VGVPVDALRDYLMSTGVLDAQKSAGKRFWDLRDQLKVKNMISERDGLVWRTDLDTSSGLSVPPGSSRPPRNGRNFCPALLNSRTDTDGKSEATTLTNFPEDFGKIAGA